MLMQLAIGFVIGLTMGLLGGGGSILAVPALVYVVGYNPAAAITASLAVVGLNSLSGVAMHHNQGTLNWRVAAVFGGAGMVTSFLAAKASQSINPTALLVAFAALMLCVGVLMLTRKTLDSPIANPRKLSTTLLAGAGVGLLTGFLGVGGGFLIVPALVMLLGLPMPVAVGTSLLIIALNSLAGLLGHLDNFSLEVQGIALFVPAGIVGTFVGAKLTQHVRPERLRQAFAIFVIVLGLFLLFDNVRKLIVI
jgi:hypothetical protein